MRAERANQTPAAVALRSTRVCEHILLHPAYRAATGIAAYVAVGHEADPATLMQAAHAAGKRVVVPRVEPDGALSLRMWSPDAPWARGSMGTREPLADAVEVALQDVQLVIVPGLAFDLQGGRLGYGKGYYDRLLSRSTDAQRLGMAFDSQLVQQVPTEAHDVPMHCVATQAGVQACEPRRQG